MPTAFIVISLDEEDAIEKPADRKRPRQNRSHYSENSKLETAHYQSTYSIGRKSSTPSSSSTTFHTPASSPRSKSTDIPPLSDVDHANIVPRSLSVPRPGYIPLGQTTRSVESQVRNRKPTAVSAAAAAESQDTPDVLITGQVTKRTSLLPQPGSNPQRKDAAPSDQSVQQIRSTGSSAGRKVPGEEAHSHTCEAKGTTSTLFDAATTAAPTTVGTFSSHRQPLPNDLSRVTTVAYEKDGFDASPNDADISPQPQGPVMEYPWPPPPSMNTASSAPDPYYKNDSRHERQQEDIQGPYFLATRKPPHNHNRQDISPSAMHNDSLRYSLTQLQRETPSQTSSSNPKRKEQPAIIERAAAPKRARAICSPAPSTIIPPTTPNHQPQPQTPFNFPSSSPPSSASTLAETPTPTPTANARRPRSRPWTSAMIADMAQTLQASFPFAEFSAKHGKTPSEVFEAFSAVVQMPLFEYSAKGMARTRMKGFQDRIRDYRDKGRDFQRMHRREEREEKGKEKEEQDERAKGRGKNVAKGEISMVAGEAEGEGQGDGGGITGKAAEKKKAALGQAAIMTASGDKRDKKKTMPDMTSSSPKHGNTPATTTTTSDGAPAAGPNTPKRRRADPIAPTRHSNKAPVLELRDGIYMLVEQE